MRSFSALESILRLAYGAQPADQLRRFHRAVVRVAAHLENQDLVLASLEAVTSGFPDLSSSALAKLAMLANLEKGGTAWQDQPRVPAGHVGGGQWTAGDDGDAGPSVHGRDGDDNARPERPAPRAEPTSLLDDGVYHPARDKPFLSPVGGPAEADDGFRQGIGGNEPPYDFMTLSELFPTWKDHPEIAVPLAPLDSFLGIGSAANEANLAATTGVYLLLSSQIRALDPKWRFDELEPLAAMDAQGRANVIKDLLMERALHTIEFEVTFDRFKLRRSASCKSRSTTRTRRRQPSTTRENSGRACPAARRSATMSTLVYAKNSNNFSAAIG